MIPEICLLFRMPESSVGLTNVTEYYMFVFTNKWNYYLRHLRIFSLKYRYPWKIRQDLVFLHQMLKLWLEDIYQRKTGFEISV